MKTRTAWVSVAALAIGLAASGVALANNSGPASLTPARVDNFRLTDNHGFAQDLRRLVDVKAIAVVSYVNGDAGSRKAAKAVEALKAKYPDVAFMMLNSTAASRTEIVAEAKAQGISVPVLDDNLQLAGEQLGVSYAGEAFLIEPKTLRVLYHGPVDGAGAATTAKGYLAEALADLSAGRAIATAQATGKGTQIKFPERDNRAAHAAISYAKDVAPVLEAKCVSCHQEGGIGPFAMSSYEAVKNFAPMIREAIRTKTMPPWHPDPAFGKFEHDGGLSGDQIRTIVHWVEAGAPRGEGADPLSAEAHVAPDWPLGKPDLVIEVPAYTVPGVGRGGLPVSGGGEPADGSALGEGGDAVAGRPAGDAPHPFRLHAEDGDRAGLLAAVGSVLWRICGGRRVADRCRRARASSCRRAGPWASRCTTRPMARKRSINRRSASTSIRRARSPSASCATS